MVSRNGSFWIKIGLFPTVESGWNLNWMLYSGLEISENHLSNFRTFFDFIFWVLWMVNFLFDLSRKMQLTCGQLIPGYHPISIIRSRSHSFRIMLYHTLFELNRHSETNCKKSDILYRPPFPPMVGHRPDSKLDHSMVQILAMRPESKTVS